MGLNKPIIISTSAVDTSNLATKSDMTTLQNSVTSALSNVGGAVKSVQRGTVNAKGTSKSVTISSIDTTKSLIFVEHHMGDAATPTSLSADYVAIGTIVSSTKIQIAMSSYGSDSFKFYWQVVEFE